VSFAQVENLCYCLGDGRDARATGLCRVVDHPNVIVVRTADPTWDTGQALYPEPVEGRRLRLSRATR